MAIRSYIVVDKVVPVVAPELLVVEVAPSALGPLLLRSLLTPLSMLLLSPVLSPSQLLPSPVFLGSSLHPRQLAANLP